MQTLRKSIYMFSFGIIFMFAGGSIVTNIEMSRPEGNQINQSLFTPTYWMGFSILTAGIGLGFSGYVNLQTLACQEETRLTGLHSPMVLDGIEKSYGICEIALKYLHKGMKFIVDKIRRKTKH